MEKRYPGIGIIGHDRISALYGVDNGIVDWQGTGIQHLFCGSFEQDLIHSGTTYIHHASKGEIELGNRRIQKHTHPIHQHPVSSFVEDGFCYTTSFDSQVNKNLSWTERVYATHQDSIIFETTFQNRGMDELSFIAGGYVILRNPNLEQLSYDGDVFSWENNKSILQVTGEEVEEITFYKESPTGFVYRTLQQTLEEKPSDPIQAFSSDTMIGVVTKKRIKIQPRKEVTVRWMIRATSKFLAGLRTNDHIQWNKELDRAREDWNTWIHTGSLLLEQFPEPLQRMVKTNLVALKASLLNGFVPADMTGHYYSNGSPSYYVRDSLMIAKAFLEAGFYKEAESIILYAASRETKDDSGEFYQRYNALGEPSEGANNNVFHQLDSQGYFLALVEKYYEKTKKWIVPYEQVKSIANVLFDVERKSGLLGPEGGVNEGVFGPAFITSSNMFIAGGLFSASRIAAHHEDRINEEKWQTYADSITNHIEKETWIEDLERYGYGFVLYADELVKKYDTPQFFGPLYGYPITSQFKRMIDASLEHVSFYEYGIGYSEQEYHHGPWMFNTAANAQCQVLVGNDENYIRIMNWMMEHSNRYGLLSEAIDGNAEDYCFINPLTWACAEFISAVSIGQQLLTKQELHMGVKI